MHDVTTPSTIDSFLANTEKRAFRMALLATKDKSESLDIVQDSMMKLVEYYSDRDASDWGPLFHKILQNNIIKWYRQQRRKKRWFWQAPPNDEEDSEFVAQAESPEWEIPDAIWERSEKVDAVVNAVEQLAIRQQQAFLLRCWEGYDTSTTAEIMECSEGSVKTHYFRALQNLRALLDDQELRNVG
ncbi:RNA polymerase sigma factor [Aurantivibrio infirmus]